MNAKIKYTDEPLGEVQVVTRLVQRQQQVGLGYQELGKPQQLLLPAAQGVGSQGQVGGGLETQLVE